LLGIIPPEICISSEQIAGSWKGRRQPGSPRAAGSGAPALFWQKAGAGLLSACPAAAPLRCTVDGAVASTGI